MNFEKEGTEAVDFPSYRIGAQVHDHEARIRLLERDSADIKKTLDAMNKTIETFAKSIDAKFNQFELHIHNDLMLHEKAEFLNQKKIMGYLISILLSVAGAGAYLIIEQTMKLP
jgi:hypothetical protein